MTSTRALVAGYLRTALAATGAADLVVLDHRRTLDQVTTATVLLAVDQVTPSPVPGAWITTTLTALIVAGRTDPGPADDDLDNALADVLHALDTTDTLGLTWSQATRVVVDDTWPGYQVTLTTHTAKEPT